MEIEWGCADQLYQDTLFHIMSYGEITHPRGFTCRELSPCHLRLTNPYSNIISNPSRKMSLGFAAAEMMWIYQGSDDVASLVPYNSKIKDFSDDGVKFFGAYGPKIKDQMPEILHKLNNDPWTRQAVLTIWRENPPQTKDVPCTVMMQYIQRPLGTLNLIVYMRSQDCWLGLPYDLHNFTCFLIIAAGMLNLKVGVFDLFQGSLHAYEQDFEKITKLIHDPLPIIDELTPSTPSDFWDQKSKWMLEHLVKKAK